MLLYISRYYLHLQLVSRFVDRDMFMRFLGYGIGHKGHTGLAASSNEAAVGDQEADNLDTANTAGITHSQPLQPTLDAPMATDEDTHAEAAGDDARVEEEDAVDEDDDTQDGDDNSDSYSRDSDAHSRYSDPYSRCSDMDESDSDPDDEDDLDGHL